MKKRKVVLTILLAFLSWVPSASAGSGVYAYLGDTNITKTTIDSNTGETLNLSGTFTAPADAGKDYAVFYADNDIHILGNFSGSATASASSSRSAFGFLAHNDITITELSGIVNATADAGTAAGLASEYGSSITIETLSGKVTATAGDDGSAFGLYAQYGGSGNDHITITNLSGTISATAGDKGQASGLAAADNITIANFSGKVTATTGDNGTAVGLGSGYSPFAQHFINIGTFSGDISSVSGAGGTSYGLLANCVDNASITIENLTGTVSATTGAGGTAYALYSGNLDYHGKDKGLGSGNDSITVSGNGKLIGNVALNGGDDHFTLKEHADISGVPLLDGGTNNDQLLFDGWSGSLGGVKVTGWETVVLRNGSTVNLGASTNSSDPKIITFPNGLTIDATSTLLAAGSSPGFYNLTGPITNSGTISLLDNHDTGDQLTIDGNYEGINGTIKFDVHTGSAAADQVIITGATSGSTKLDLYELGIPTSPATRILLLTTVPAADPGIFTAGEYMCGPKLYTFTLTEDAGSYYFSSPQFERYHEEAALLQGVTPFVENPGFESLAGFHDRHAYNLLACGEKESPMFWARAYGSSFAIGQTGDAATTIKGFSGGTQVGGDFLAHGTGKVASQYHIGGYAGTGWQKADIGGILKSKAGELTQNVYNLGLYASIERPECYFIEGVVQSGYHYIDIIAPDEPGGIKTNTWSFLSSIEGGLTLQTGSSLRLEPQAQLIYQHIGDMHLSTLIGDATIESHDGLRTRLGLTGTFTKTGVPFNPFLRST